VAEKKRILTAHIFGVDIDRQAVEVTKLSLLLKVLEGENDESLQLKLFDNERALPNLDANIKCGNSLIGPGYFNARPTGFWESRQVLDDELRRVNPFDWQHEFPDAAKQGGFDCIIGNPPYISVELTVKDVMDYYLSEYETAYGRANSFSVFIEKGLALLKDNGHCGLIVSNRLLTNTQLASLRKFLLDNSAIETIVTFGKTVFEASVDTTVITFKKSKASQEHYIEVHYDVVDLNGKDIATNMIPQRSYLAASSYIFNVRQRTDLNEIIQRIRTRSVKLGQICDVKDGIILGDIKDLFLSDKRVDKRYEKWLEGNEVSRYLIEWTGRYICYDKSLIDEELKRKREKAKRQAVTSADFEKLSRSGIWLRNPEVFRQEKILTRQNAKRLIGVLDTGNFFVKNSLHCTSIKDQGYGLKYVLGLINSRLMDFYFQDQIGNTGEIFSQMKIAYIRELPIRPIDFTNAADKAAHDRMVKLVDTMLQLQPRLAAAQAAHDRDLIQRQIDATDRQIDALVYQLYGLTEEEIKIVEGRA
jgi:hypothetical protein